MATVTSLGFNIFSRYSGDGVRRARRDIRSLNDTIVRVDRINQAISGLALQGLMGVAVATASAMVGLGRAVLGVAGSVTAMAVSGGAAAGVFGLAVFGAVKRLKNLVDQGKPLNSMQRTTVASFNNLKSAYERFIDATQNRSLSVVNDVLRGTGAAVGKLLPIFNAVYPSIKRVSVALREWLSGFGMDRFVATIVNHGVPALNALLNAGRHTLAFLGIGFRAFAPLGVEVAEALERGALALRKWAEGGGFTRFIAKIREDGPMVRAFFNALWDALKQVTKAMDGLGPLAFGLATALLRLIAVTPVPMLQAMIIAFTVYKAVVVGLIVQKALLTAAHLLFGNSLLILRARVLAYYVLLGVIKIATAAWAAIQWVLNAALLANPIGLVVIAIAALVAAIVWIATQTTWFQTAWTYAWNFIKTVFMAVWTAIQAVASVVWTGLRIAWQALCTAFVVVWQAVSAALVVAWNFVWNAMKIAAEFIWNALKFAWNLLIQSFIIVWQVVSAALVIAWNFVWNAMKIAAEFIWNALKFAWNLLVQSFIIVWQVVSAALVIAWNFVWNAMKIAAEFIWNALKFAWNLLVQSFIIVWQAVSAALVIAWNFVWNAMKIAAEFIWNALRIAWGVFTGSFVTIWQAVSGALVVAWNFVWNAIRTVATAIWNGLQIAWQVFVNALRTIWQVVGGAISVAWNAVWNGIRTVVVAVWNAIQAAATFFWNLLRTTFSNGLTGIEVLWRGVWNAVGALFQVTFNFIRNNAAAFWSFLTSAFNIGLNGIRSLWTTVWNAVGALFQATFNFIRNNASAFWNFLRNAFSTGLNFIRNLWQTVWDAAGRIFQATFNFIRNNASAFWNFARSLFTSGLNFVRNLWQTIWDACGRIFQATFNFIRNNASAFWNFARSLFTSGLNFIRNLWQTIWDAVGRIFQVTFNFIRNNATAFWNTLRNMFNTALNAIKSAWEAAWNAMKSTAQRLWNDIGNVIESAINGIIGIINKIIGGFNKVAAAVKIDVKIGEIPKVNFAHGGMVVPMTFAHGGRVPKNLKRGGSIPGYRPGRDTVPAMLSPGEGVLTPEAVRGLGGPGFVHGANRKFAGHRGAGRGASARAFSGRRHDSDRMALGGVVQNFAVGGMAAASLNALGIPLSAVIQGEYSNGALSGGTHAGAGVVDLPPNPVYLTKLIQAGWAAWMRGPAQGFSPHIHAVQMNNPGLSGPARAQVASFLAGGNGLGSGGGGGGGGIFDFLGELLGNIGNVLRDIALGKGVGKFGEILLSMLGMIGADPFKEAFDWAFDLFDKWNNPAGDVGKIFLGMGKTLLQGLIDFLIQKDSEATPKMGGGGDVQRWAPLAAKALQIAGLASNQLSKFLALMQQESGGNPNAINNWDSNAARGQASRGLMQVIPSTFAAYRDPSLGGIMDPLSNMVAAARYIKARYGGNVPGSPYALGTSGATKGWHLVGERGPEMVKFRGGERVVPNGDLYGRGRGENIVIEMPITVNGNMDSAAVQRLEQEVIPKLRMLLQQKVGRR